MRVSGWPAATPPQEPLSRPTPLPSGGRVLRSRKTVIAKSSVLAFGRPFYREGLLSKAAIVRAPTCSDLHARRCRRGEDKLRAAMLPHDPRLEPASRGPDRARDPRRGRHPDHLQEALDLIAEHQAAGTVMRSRHPGRWCARETYLGVDDVLATRPTSTTPELHRRARLLSYGPHKAEAISALAATNDIDLAASWAYSDSITDEPMLRTVGHPVAVNPDKELGRLAHRGLGDPQLRQARPAPEPDVGPGAGPRGQRGDRRRRRRRARSELVSGATGSARGGVSRPSGSRVHLAPSRPRSKRWARDRRLGGPRLLVSATVHTGLALRGARRASSSTSVPRRSRRVATPSSPAVDRRATTCG